ncbi:MAG: hypothetical protein WC348_03785 [Patescibacteria group bacterium]|jgi:hypothetical protein
MKNFLPIFIAIVIIVGGGAFYGGMKYGENKKISGARDGFADFKNFPSGGQARLGSPGGKVGGVNFTNGEIISTDDKSVTIKLPDGGSKIIFFSDSTKITKSLEGTAADLVAGETIAANGTANQDGSITAETIQLRPAMPTPENADVNMPVPAGN